MEGDALYFILTSIVDCATETMSHSGRFKGAASVTGALAHVGIHKRPS